MATRLVLAGLTVVASWTLADTTFALHYAHHYYGDRPAAGAQQDRGGLTFPGEEQSDYWDFLYFSFVIGMTCQVSDMQVTSRPMRRLTLVHGVLSFFFNILILALAVNLLASSLRAAPPAAAAGGRFSLPGQGLGKPHIHVSSRNWAHAPVFAGFGEVM